MCPLTRKYVKFLEKLEFGSWGLEFLLEMYDQSQSLFLSEGQGMGWVKLEEINSLKIAEHNLEILEKIKPILEWQNFTEQKKNESSGTTSPSRRLDTLPHEVRKN